MKYRIKYSPDASDRLRELNKQGRKDFILKKHVKIHVNHALKHRNNEGTRVDYFVNPPAYISHIRGKNSRVKNPTLYHSQAGKSNGRI